MERATVGAQGGRRGTRTLLHRPANSATHSSANKLITNFEGIHLTMCGVMSTRAPAALYAHNLKCGDRGHALVT